MSQKVRITTKGIRSVLRKYDHCQAIAEYIWNGFDAHASCVEFFYTANEIGSISELRIRDNGSGINHTELNQKFGPFFESEKLIEYGGNKHHSLTHGKNGVGRLTFFTFATKATWQTTFQSKDKNLSYNITIESESLENFTGAEVVPVENNEGGTGTEVCFKGLHNINEGEINKELVPFLIREFAWFLELNKHHGFAIKINGNSINYDSLIGENDSTVFVHPQSNTTFNISYLRWKESLNKEFSRYYYVDSKKSEKWKNFTTLNNKGDHFYHSIFIESDYFDNFNFQGKDNGQGTLVGGTISDDQFKFLDQELTNYLRKKRKPFLREYADKLISEYEKDGAIPKFKSEGWEQLKKTDLEDNIRGLYEIQPKIFSQLNLEQKKTFVGFLNLLLDSDEREKILDIVGKVVDLDSDERAELVELLKSTKLSRIISTIQLIEDRYKTINQLKELVFNESLNANERDHVQKFIENNYWIFGEQFNLVVSAEKKFDEALRRYNKIIHDENKEVAIDHPDKNGEMDIFICRQNKLTDSIDNIVVELKSPKIKLGEKHLQQVKKYMKVILSEAQFNAPNMDWEFYLVGNSFDTSGDIEREMENAKSHGEKSLVFKTGKYKVFVKTWSEVFTEFECRYKFLDEKLKLDRDNMIGVYVKANDVLESAGISV